jgi:inositol monophosphatase 3
LEVIEGRATVYLHVTAIKKWDVCAGNALLIAAGGSLTDLYGDKLDYSADSSPLNEKGILATLQDPKPFLEHLDGIKLL